MVTITPLINSLLPSCSVSHTQQHHGLLEPGTLQLLRGLQDLPVWNLLRSLPHLVGLSKIKQLSNIMYFYL